MGNRLNRVGVTGMGVLAPGGNSLDRFWDSLVGGHSGVRQITLFDASELRSRIAGEVCGFKPEDYIPDRLKPRRLARQTQFAVAATRMALEDARLDLHSHPEVHPVGVVIGSAIASMDVVFQASQAMVTRGLSKASPLFVGAVTTQSTGTSISDLLGVPTEVRTVSTACASGLDAIGLAYSLIQHDKADVVITGGTDCPIMPMPFANMVSAGLCATRNDEPAKAGRPFDADRETGVVSEGCGLVVLENLDFARSRGCEPYLEISGFSTEMDDVPDCPGSGYRATMSKALANAAMRPEDVDWVSAWAPGHPMLDKVEVDMIKKVFGNHAFAIPVTSIKGTIGNPLSATGPIMLIAVALSFRENLVPHTLNWERTDPDCDLDHVRDRPRASDLDCALLNAHGVGGGNSSLIVTRPRP